MKERLRICSLSFLIVIAALFLSPTSRAQDDTGEAKGKDSGNYHIEQSIEFGYRATYLNGDMNTYDTFVNLGQGWRLFDYTLDMRSLNHQGIFFDNLSFSNFGYGGDPNNVSRLHLDKNKWYNFSVLFRRDKNFWDWPLLANPLNEATAIAPAVAVPITNSPHGLDLVRRMQDYNLTLLPESRLRFRLGYSRNVDEGPAFTTAESGILPVISENVRETVNAYRAGIDFRFLPKTTFSYDQYLKYYKEDNSGIDQNATATPAPGFPGLTYQLANATGVGTPNGTPVDLGLSWNTAVPTPGTGGTALSPTPCAGPVTSATSTPFPTAKATCSGILSYSFAGRPRNYMPTESFRFQSTYFKNLTTSGAVGYSTSDNVIPDYSELVNGWISRTGSRGGTTSGPATAKRVSVNANWSGVYSVTDRLRILDNFMYDNWRIPGTWSATLTNTFGTPPPAAGLAGMLLPVAQFSAPNCPAAPYNQANCPQHSSGSAADFETEAVARFLGQNVKQNTLELQYDFTKRISARIGYLYLNRKIADFNSVFDTAETYYPGGSTGTAANLYLAARGQCALVAGALPAGCTQNADGSITFAGLDPSSDSARNVTDINESALVAGVTARPVDSLRVTGDFVIGYSNYAFTRISPRQLQSYKIHASYTPKPWATLDGAIDIHENRDNVYQVDNLEHSRMYSFTTTLSPNPRLALDFGYNYGDIHTQAFICYPFNNGVSPVGADCPITGQPTPETGLLSLYQSTDHFPYADVMWKPTKRVATTLGFSGSFVRGSTSFLNPLTPDGTLDFNYLRPYASIAVDLYKGFTYKMAWNYFGYDSKGFADPTALAPIGSRNFNGSNATFSVRYAF